MATAGAATFDGSAAYLSRGTDLGASDSKIWSGMLFFRRSATQGSEQRIIYSSGGSYRLIFQSDNTFRFEAENTSGTAILRKDTSTAITDTTNWHVILWSFNLGTGDAYVYVDDSNDLAGGGLFTNDTIDFNSGDHWIGAGGAAFFYYPGELGPLWYTSGTAFDFSDSANRRLFHTPDSIPKLAKDLNDDGTSPGVNPVVWLNNEFSTYQNNLGSGGNFTENGTLTTSTGPEIEEDQADIAGGLPATQLEVTPGDKEALGGGLPQIAISARLLAGVVGGGLVDADVLKVGAGRTNVNAPAVSGGLVTDTVTALATPSVQFCLLLEDDSSKFLLEDNASCIIIETTQGLTFSGLIGGGLADIARKVNLSFEALGGGLPGTVEVGASRILNAAALAGGLAAKQIKKTVLGAALAGGLGALGRSVRRSFAALGVGLADARTALAGALTAITAAATAGGLSGKVLRRLITASATCGVVLVSVVDLLPKIIFTGGLGTIGNVGRSWTSWRTKSRQ